MIRILKATSISMTIVLGFLVLGWMFDDMLDWVHDKVSPSVALTVVLAALGIIIFYIARDIYLHDLGGHDGIK